MREVPGGIRTSPTKVPLLLPSSRSTKSAPWERRVAWRRLTVGSGSRTSHPAPRPRTIRCIPSNVSREAVPLAGRTMTVIGMRGSGGRDARQGGAVLLRVALDPRDDLLGDVSTHVAAQLLDPG